MKYLPIGISTFRDIIKGNFVYVDKTKYIYELIRPEKAVYFLSRPRRFGKSLLISTLYEIFKGNKELFKGLYIYNTDYDWEDYPIIRISFGGKLWETKEVLKEYIKSELKYIADKYNIKLPDLSFDDSMRILIRLLYEKYNKPVIILIDEYDKPILDVIEDLSLAKHNRDTLRAFYTIIKEEDMHIKFVFLTGVSKFSKTGVFSGLNNLNDITMNTKYSAMLGVTQEELVTYFEEYIDELGKAYNIDDREKILSHIKRWYNGYCFSENCIRIYNPFSLLLLFDNKRFSNFWFETGTPTFLIKIIKNTPDFNISEYIGKYLPEYAFSRYDIEDLKPFPLLFQTGYLTIKDTKIENEIDIYYRIDFPNYEVKSAFLDVLLMSLSPSVRQTGGREYVREMIDALQNKDRPDFPTFFDILSVFFANIPYDIQIKKEVYYQTIFYTVFLLLGLIIETEIKTNKGRIDVIIKDKEKNRLFVFEFKLKTKDTNYTPDDALKQIIDKDYTQKYKDTFKNIYLIGVVFDMDQRNIGEWKTEVLGAG